MIFDPADPNIKYGTLPAFDWKEFYGHVKEAIPRDALPPGGNGVDLAAGEKTHAHNPLLW